MVYTTQQLKEKYSNLADPIGRIHRDIRNGKLFPLVRGVYETNPNMHGSRIAQFIYGPSYLSFEYVLYQQGLIPEAVYNTFTCATFNKQKIKTYTNRFGTFVYRDIPKDVFSLGVLVFQDGDYSYQVATPEKALCDKLYTVSPVRSAKELKQLLFDDLRIDEERFDELNENDILKMAPLYHSTNLNFLTKYIRGDK